MKFEFLENKSDIMFKAYGSNLEKAFENSALALKETITQGKKINSKISKEIFIEGKDLENLLYNFLEEFLYLVDAEDFVLNKITKIKINLDKIKLEAKLSGDKFSKYKINSNVKAVTYNKMFIKKEKESWVSQVVLDV